MADIQREGIIRILNCLKGNGERTLLSFTKNTCKFTDGKKVDVESYDHL